MLTAKRIVQIKTVSDDVWVQCCDDGFRQSVPEPSSGKWKCSTTNESCLTVGQTARVTRQLSMARLRHGTLYNSCCYIGFHGVELVSHKGRRAYCCRNPTLPAVFGTWSCTDRRIRMTQLTERSETAQSRSLNACPQRQVTVVKVSRQYSNARGAIPETEFFAFYPRDAMLARVIGIATCPSVSPSVCLSVRHAPVLCQNEES